MSEPPAPGLNLTWRAVALAACDTLAALWIAHALAWVASYAWAWLAS